MMAKLFPHYGLLALCSLALPAAAVAQDASIGFGQDSTTTQSPAAARRPPRPRPPAVRIRNHAATFPTWKWTLATPTTAVTTGAMTAIAVPPPINDSDLFGDWTLGQENGSSCTITLKDSQWFGGCGAWVPAGCPDGFYPVDRWLLSGNQLLLTDTNNQVIGRFRPSGGGRWSGRRESDGTRIYLNPRQR